MSLDVAPAVVMLGVVIGATYGLLAVGLVLVFRSDRVVNFAHGETGAFAAGVFGAVVARTPVPYWAAFPAALAVGALVAALTQLAVGRVRDAPRLVSLVVTIGVAEVLALLSMVVSAQARGLSVPEPPGLPAFTVGVLRVAPSATATLVLSPLVVAALVWLLQRSTAGLHLRAVTADRDAARACGIFPARTVLLAWVLAGALAAFTAVLLAPATPFVGGRVFGPILLLRALAAAVVAGMRSLPIALGAGVVLGVVEQALLWNVPRGGMVEVALFGVIVVALLARPSSFARRDELPNSGALTPWPPLAERHRRSAKVRAAALAAQVAVIAAVGLVLATSSNRTAVTLTGIAAFSIVGLSVGVITGLAGQLTLGQFALAAVGATVSFHVSVRTGNFVLSFTLAGLATAGVSALLGLPALRIHGLMLAVVTLSFALVTSQWLLEQPWMLGEGVVSGHPIVGSFVFEPGRRYAALAFVVLLLVVYATRNVRRSGVGRRFVAVRDNPGQARAFGLSPTGVTLQAFAVAGFLAGVGGAVFGHSLALLSAQAFPLGSSIDVVAMTLVGGIAILVGPLLGALYVIGVPAFVPLDSAALAATAAGWLLLVLYAPGGLVQLLAPLHRFILSLLVSDDAEAHPPSARVVAPSPPPPPGPPPPGARGEALLVATAIRHSFDGVTALDGVDLAVAPGEAVGIIGPNGAGKSTLLAVLSGFLPADAGRVVYDGEDVTAVSPEGRARRGVVRSFQQLTLFPTMTVRDTIQLASEGRDATRLLPAAAGVRGRDRRKEQQAAEVIDLLGLGAYDDHPVAALSTGTRRVVEMACLLVLRPRLLLLDEPSSGLAQAETEALGALLERLRAQSGAALVIVEHDLPLVFGIAGRIVALSQGRVIAEGPPAAVRADETVARVYLGQHLPD